ncbi:DUF6134 family protein [Hyphomonas sp.]|uniref:DUF6134 family protein n=1 Tax=Hyphomonas sp. TaxID=87 RepID=UPI00391941DF
MTVRSLLILLISLVFATSAQADTPVTPGKWQPSAGDEIRFNVLRQGQAFGSHAVRFEEGADGSLIARTDVSLKAGLGPVTLYRYQLEAAETWANGQLVKVSGKVNDDGKRRSVTAAREGAALKVKGSDFTGTAPKEVVPASHWNYAQTMTRKLLSTEDGEILDVRVDRIGRETIEAGGKTIEANRYRLDSALDVDLWYDDDGRWVKLAFEARGQKIEYVLDRFY